jgi:NAD(P)H-hydrate epimerase
VPPKADVNVIGMGLGISVSTEVIPSRLLSGSKGRFVLDADALSILANWYGKKDGYDPAKGQELVLTPHEGEAARLLGWTKEQVAADRLATAKEIVDRYGATVVLKGARTLVVSADGSEVYENRTGNPFMALGGMGDLLAGMIGARWAYLKGDPFLAAASAVWMHGAASDEVVKSALDASVVNTANTVGSMRVRLDGAGGGA